LILHFDGHRHPVDVAAFADAKAELLGRGLPVLDLAVGVGHVMWFTHGFAD
jgi:hypothetical protein